MKRFLSAIYVFLLVWSAVALIGAEIRPELSGVVVLPAWSAVVASPLILVAAVAGAVEPREAFVWASAIVFISFLCLMLLAVPMGFDVDRRPDPVGLALSGVQICVAAAGAVAWIRSRRISVSGEPGER